MSTVREWFPHDYYASRDIKLMRLLRLAEGPTGSSHLYGMYWYTVEMLHFMPDATLFDVVDALQIGLRVQPEMALQFIKECDKLGLFFVDQDGPQPIVQCERVQRNIEARQQVTERKRSAASKRWNAGAVQEQCSSNARAMPDIIDRQIDKNKQREDIGPDGLAPSSEVKSKAKPGADIEVVQYFAELGMPESEAHRFKDYYTSNGWKVGRVQMKDWRAAARNWRKGYMEKAGQRGDTAQRTAPQGLPAQVIEIAQRQPISETDRERFKAMYLSKVSPDE